MKKTDVKFELEQVFLLDAADIIAARQRSLVIHHATNIDAAGDEVEVAVRRALTRRLPGGIYVGQGHIIDENCSCSGQLDVIIADTFGCPIFFQSENGTEFFPYESVYAVGEVRSSYRSIDDIEGFVQKLQKVKEGLKRDLTPPEFLSTGRGRGFQMVGMLSMDRRPFKNPLFSFMIFVDSRKFSPKHIRDIYKSRKPSQVPNILCFLDRGVVAFARFDGAGQFAGVHYEPQFASFYEEPAMKSRWIWLHSEHERYASATHLGWLYFTLSSHIRNCMLMPPDLMKYGQHVLSVGNPAYEYLC